MPFILVAVTIRGAAVMVTVTVPIAFVPALPGRPAINTVPVIIPTVPVISIISPVIAVFMFVPEAPAQRTGDHQCGHQ